MRKILLNTGARSKVVERLNTDDVIKMNTESDAYYESIREGNNRDLIEKIARNSKMSYANVDKIINHIFKQEHKFLDGRMKRFDSASNIILALERLRTGEHTEDDVLLLKHELAELTYMRNKKYTVYEIAHKMANEKYNWEKVLKKNEDVQKKV